MEDQIQHMGSRVSHEILVCLRSSGAHFKNEAGAKLGQLKDSQGMIVAGGSETWNTQRGPNLRKMKKEARGKRKY